MRSLAISASFTFADPGELGKKFAALSHRQFIELLTQLFGLLGSAIQRTVRSNCSFLCIDRDLQAAVRSAVLESVLAVRAQRAADKGDSKGEAKGANFLLALKSQTPWFAAPSSPDESLEESPLGRNLSDLLSSLCEFCHAKCARIVETRTKVSSALCFSVC